MDSQPVTAFISYAERDGSDFAKRLEQALEARGFNVWVDYEGIALGTRWRDEIQNNLVSSDVVLFVITPGSAASKECRRELDYAAELGKRIIPINHIPVAIEELPPLIPTLNWVPRKGTFADPFEENLDHLVQQCKLDPDWLQGHTEFGKQAIAWDQADRARGHLLRGSRLAEAERWLAGRANKEPAPTALHDELVFSSRRAATRRQRGGASIAAIVLVLIAGLALIAVIERGNAVEQRNTAEEQRNEAQARALSSAALLALDSDPEAAVEYARQSLDIRETPTGADALRLALDRSDIRRRITVPARDPEVAERYADSGFLAEHERGTTLAVDYSPDGKRIATAGSTGDVTVLDAETGKVLLETGADFNTVSFSGVEFDPRGRRLLVTGDEGRVRIFDAESGDEQITVDHGEQAEVALFSPDGTRVVTGGDSPRDPHYDGAIRIWDASNGRLLEDLPNHSQPTYVGTRLVARGPGGGVVAVNTENGSSSPLVEIGAAGAFIGAGADNGLLAAAVDDEVHLFDINSGNRVRVLSGHSGRIGGLSTSADGRLIASQSQDGTSHIWDVASGDEVGVLAGHATYVQDVDFDPVERSKLVTTSRENLLTWEVQEADHVRDRHEAPDVGDIEGTFEGATVLPDDTIVAGSFGNHTVFGDKSHEDLDAIFELEESDAYRIAQVGLGPEGEAVAVGSDEATSTTALFVGGSDPAAELPVGEDTAPQGALLDAERRRAFFSYLDGSIKVLRAEGNPLELDRACHEGTETGVSVRAVSPDGRRLVTSQSAEGTCIRPVESGRATRLEGGGDIGDAVFIDGGAKVITGSFDRTARVWDAGSGRQLLVVQHEESVTDVAPGVDDSYFLTMTGASGEGFSDPSIGRVNAWSTQTGRRLFEFPGQRFVTQLSDGAIVTRDDHDVLVYNCDICRPLDELRELAPSRVTREIEDPL